MKKIFEVSKLQSRIGIILIIASMPIITVSALLSSWSLEKVSMLIGFCISLSGILITLGKRIRKKDKP